MKKFTCLLILLLIVGLGQSSFAQSGNGKFKMEGSDPETLEINETFSSSVEIPFDKKLNKIFGVSVTAKVSLEDENSIVRFILIDEKFNEHLIYETYSLLEEDLKIDLNEVSEETSLLDKINPYSVRLEIEDAIVTLEKLTVTTTIDPIINFGQLKKQKRTERNEDKIQRINKKLEQKGLKWKAGKTGVSELSYAEKKQLFGQSNFPAGIEYYSGGIISAGDVSLKSAAVESPYVKSWDWRNRHGRNWISPITNQKSCGSCWAFAAAGATEAMVNVYYNQQLNLDLSEQDLLSCSGAGDCLGGFPSMALDYITSAGIVDEGAFPYSSSEEACTNKGNSPSEVIKIGGRVDFGSSFYPKTEDVLKKMLIEMGPVSGGLYDWRHAMVLVGYKVVEEGDRFYYTDLDLNTYWITIQAGDPVIGKTVWIFKNSWGANYGDNGYVYVETPMSNIGWTHGLKTPVTSEVQNYQVVCEDRDGDGYYWWGIGEKPATCAGPDLPDGDDSDPTLGPLDEYGNCTLLTAVPIANFSADKTSVEVGESVQFSDLSGGNVTSWSWSFEGGSPSVSEEKNPVVTYESAGNFQVSLTVSNSNGTDTKTTAAYIAAQEPVEPVAEYCISSGSSEQEWIASVEIKNDKYTSGVSALGYQDFTTSKIFKLTTGEVNYFNLSPGYANRPREEYWQIWIDLNADMDFDDDGELLYTSSSVKGTVSGSFVIPSGIEQVTRMRIAMKRRSPAGACEIFSQGEVEDYMVEIGQPVPQPPVASFTTSNSTILVNETVQFTDLSSNEPTRWQWYFPGGNPETSTVQHPAVIYTVPGEYDVSLTVFKDGFDSSTQTKSNFVMVVEEVVAEYCTPTLINSSSDYVQQVVVGNALNTSSAGEGYLMMPQEVILVPGRYYDVSLSPFNESNRNYWKIWIDFNGDGDFNDADETLLTAKNKRGAFTDGIVIPDYANGTTRMRIAMRNEKDMDACDDNYTGEIEDYAVSFTAPAQQMAVTGVNMVDRDFEIEVYPNPVSDNVYLKIKSFNTGDFYSVYSVNGEELVKSQILSTESMIDFSRYSSGVYLLNINTGNQTIRKKIVKQ